MHATWCTVSAVATDLFLGGWHGPFLPRVARLDLVPAQGRLRCCSSTCGCAWTLPRYRYDQLMAFGWKVLLPIAVVNLLVDRGRRAVFRAVS